jgi:hypothetical protein
MRQFFELCVGSEVDHGEIKKLADHEQGHDASRVLSLVRGKEEFELFVQALAIAGLKDPEQPLLQGHRPPLRTDQEVLHQLVGILGLQGALLFQEADAGLEEFVVQFDLRGGVLLPVWLPLLRFAQSLDQLLDQGVLPLCLKAPLLPRLLVDEDANQIVCLLDYEIAGFELGERYGEPL